jgi:hypothetical protein
MKHFTDWQWVDFARGVAEGEDRQAMEAHLASGCSRCYQRVTRFHQMTAMAQAETATEPPDSAIRYAKALFSLHRPEQSSVARIIGRLIHDSSLAPLAAGLRAEASSTRYLLYEAGPYYLDVQVEREAGSDRLNLVGQLSDRSVPPTSTANLPIWLMHRKRLVASAFSNSFGEFQLACAPAGVLELRVPLPALGKRMDVQLRSLNGARKKSSGSSSVNKHRSDTAN